MRESEATKKTNSMSRQLNELQGQLKMKNNSISSLEKELNEANLALESSALIRKSNNLTLTPPKHYNADHGYDYTGSNNKQSVETPSSSSRQEFKAASSVSSQPQDNAVLHAIQAQRDRYMKVAKENEQEVLLLKTRLDR